MDNAPPARVSWRESESEDLNLPSSVSRLGHRPALDGLRGVAILLVLAVNSSLPVFRGGFIGVDIFFVLSGFLITCLLIQEWNDKGTIHLKRFYARRALRLLPALLVLLLAVCAYGALFQSRAMGAETGREALWVLFYLANWMLALRHEVGALDHAWSLSVEEQFYFLWPAALCFLLNRQIRLPRIFVGLLAVAALSGAWRGYLWSEGTHHLRLYFGSDTRADALLIGCAVGVLFSTGRLQFSARSCLACSMISMAGSVLLAGAVCLTSHETPFLYQGGFTLIGLGAATLLIETARSPSGVAQQILAFPPLAWTGRISYSLYLWHYPILHALRIERFESWHWNPFAAQIVRLSAVFLVACASFYLIEQPFLRLKGRFAETE